MKKIGLILLLAIFFLPGKSQNLDSLLLLYYPFSGNANDASGNNYHGTVFNATLCPDRFGNPDRAYCFNGINSYIDFPNTPALKPPLPLTISFWVKFESTNWLKCFILDTDFEQNNYTGIHVNLLPSFTMEFSYGGGAGNTSSSNRRSKNGTTPLQIGIWYHVVGVIKGPVDMDIYINCINDNGSYTGSGGPMSYSNIPGTIGRVDSDVNGPPYTFQGALDDLRYWSRALSADEVNKLCVLTEIEEPMSSGKNKMFNIFPNPVENSLQIQMSSGEDNLFYEVFNIRGELVLTGQTENQKDISVIDLQDGLYVIRITTGSDVYFSKFVKHL